MDDVFLKFGLVIVAVGVIGVMIAWVSGSVLKIPLFPGQAQASLSGAAFSLQNSIGALCDQCIKESQTDRDCNIIHIDLTEGNITSASYDASVSLSSDILAGRHTLRIRANNSVCEVDVIE